MIDAKKSRYQVTVPEGRDGAWAVERFTVHPNDPHALYYALHHRPVYPGVYTRLVHHGAAIMSDTPAEIGDHWEVMRRLGWLEADSSVLIHGLGLGMVLKHALSNPYIQNIDVVELAPEVIRLVGPHYRDSRLTIHEGDARVFKWPRGKRWNIVGLICAPTTCRRWRICIGASGGAAIGKALGARKFSCKSVGKSAEGRACLFVGLKGGKRWEHERISTLADQTR